MTIQGVGMQDTNTTRDRRAAGLGIGEEELCCCLFWFNVPGKVESALVSRLRYQDGFGSLERLSIEELFHNCSSHLAPSPSWSLSPRHLSL